MAHDPFVGQRQGACILSSGNLTKRVQMTFLFLHVSLSVKSVMCARVEERS